MNLDVIDVVFRLTGSSSLPAGHGYLLYCALSRQLPWLHETDRLGVFPLRGDFVTDRVRTGTRTTLRIRTPSELLPQVITLTGQRLRLGDGKFTIGVPHIQPLRPAASLYARFVQIKLADAADGVSPGAFLHSAQKQLATTSIQAAASIPTCQRGRHAGEPQRRILHIKGERHVGFAMLVEGLTADESLRLQEKGLGGRRKMGCGLFLPIRGVR